MGRLNRGGDNSSYSTGSDYNCSYFVYYIVLYPIVARNTPHIPLPANITLPMAMYLTANLPGGVTR